jgi:hypothetical protein
MGRFPCGYLRSTAGKRRLAVNPPDSEWGKRMFAKKADYAREWQARARGINPTDKATRVRLANQRRRRAEARLVPANIVLDPRMGVGRPVATSVRLSPAQQDAARARRFLARHLAGRKGRRTVVRARRWPHAQEDR